MNNATITLLSGAFYAALFNPSWAGLIIGLIVGLLSCLLVDGLWWLLQRLIRAPSPKEHRNRNTFDFIDKLRHYLIRKLSCGDMILLNFEIRSDGSFINRNLGPVLIDRADITAFDKDTGLYVGRGYRGNACLGLATSEATISNSTFRVA